MKVLEITRVAQHCPPCEQMQGRGTAVPNPYQSLTSSVVWHQADCVSSALRVLHTGFPRIGNCNDHTCPHPRSGLSVCLLQHCEGSLHGRVLCAWAAWGKIVHMEKETSAKEVRQLARSGSSRDPAPAPRTETTNLAHAL